MTRLTRAPLLASALAALLLPAAARADFVSYDYAWTPDQTGIPADPPDIGALVLTSERGAGITSRSADVKASELRVFSLVPDSIPDVIINAPYGLTLALTDNASGATGTLKFKGLISGTFSADSAMLNNQFLEPTTQKLKLGTNTYTVQFGPFIPPTGGSPGMYGSLGAHISVASDGGPPVNEVPEPAGIVLAGAGLAALAARAWRRGRCAAGAGPATPGRLAVG